MIECNLPKFQKKQQPNITDKNKANPSTRIFPASKTDEYFVVDVCRINLLDLNAYSSEKSKSFYMTSLLIDKLSTVEETYSVKNKMLNL